MEPSFDPPVQSSWGNIYWIVFVDTPWQQKSRKQLKDFTFQQTRIWRPSRTGAGRSVVWLLQASHWASPWQSFPCGEDPVQWICFGWCGWLHGWVRRCCHPRPFWQQCVDNILQYRASVSAAPFHINTVVKSELTAYYLKSIVVMHVNSSKY